MLGNSVLTVSSAVSWSLSLVLGQPRIVAELRRRKAIDFKPLSIRMDSVASTG